MVDSGFHSWIIKKTNETCLCMVGFTIPNIAGTIVLLTVEQSNKTKGGLVAAFYIYAAFWGGEFPRTMIMREATAADDE